MMLCIMNVDLTIFYSSILTFLFIFLSFRVIALRGAPFLKFLAFTENIENKDIALKQSIRAQGNFLEYTPIFIILLFLAENNGVSLFFLNILSIIFTVSRALHGIYFGFLNSYIAPEKFKQTKKNSLFFICRVGPTLLTIFSILTIAILNLVNL